MDQNQLRIEQYETVLYNANINPLGLPDSVKNAILNNISSIGKYPEIYYRNLKTAVAEYVGSPIDTVITGNGSSDLIRLFIALVAPKKALLLVPSASDYEAALTSYNVDIDYYQLDAEKEYTLDVDDLISHLDSSIDMIIIGNPNNPTSRITDAASISALAEAAKDLGIFLVIDEMYIEFVDNYAGYTSVPLTKEFSNIAIIRSVSKFFAVPGLCFAYAIMNNTEMKQLIDITTTKNNISTLSAVAVTEMLKDKKYIDDSAELIHTERNLVYMAMSTNQNISLTKPDANFMLMKILNPEINSSVIADHCNQRGIIIRKCDNIRGLGDKYIRFCFMKPKQNDLCVNTILESV